MWRWEYVHLEYFMCLVPQQVRFSHVDVTNVPSFDAHRLESTKDPKSISSKTEVDRKVFTYTIAFGKWVILI